MGTKIVIPETVIKRLNELPKEIRIEFWEQIEKLIKNPSYPGLGNEKLEGTNQWAFSITMNYRATYFRSESTHSTPRSEARGMLRVDTERRFLPRFKNRGLAPSNVSSIIITAVGTHKEILGS